MIWTGHLHKHVVYFSSEEYGETGQGEGEQAQQLVQTLQGYEEEDTSKEQEEYDEAVVDHPVDQEPSKPKYYNLEGKYLSLTSYYFLHQEPEGCLPESPRKFQ